MTLFRIPLHLFRPRAALAVVSLTMSWMNVDAQDLIPHAQDAPPGPALSPAEAIAKMTVPKGFVVEAFATEPMVVNPVAMTFDDAGRVWITESLEYPRREPGPGRDRVKVLEDTDGDGKADKATIFAEGLNIPSGIAVGHGGVWVANAPDLLFLQDTDGDGKADKTEVIVTGFGRDDTHELPNSLTWGPDGWLYGWNGVFNPSKIVHRGKTHEFTCAIFRIHPVTRDFELFCEGTSNPWGIAVNAEGELFASACVIDHLWHLTETGYYHRQGGPYPPFTWKLESIVDYKHQKAAYCGIHFFDGANFPAEYRRKLMMGNIHGNAINLDSVVRNGSTYSGVSQNDFLQANDSWFMPVVQKTGPDGALYLVDWYDRYHCYQDANRDPAGIDRLKGRIYRVRYAANPLLPKEDLAKKSGLELVDLLGHDNVWHRETARRLLVERNLDGQKDVLVKLVTDSSTPRDKRLGALFALASTQSIPEPQSRIWIDDADPTVRAWVVRYYGSLRNEATPRMAARVAQQASDANPDVALQAAIALGKFPKQDPLPGWSVILQEHGGDKIIPRIIFRNLEPRLAAVAADLPEILADLDLKSNAGAREIFPHIYERLLFAHPVDTKALPWLLSRILESEDHGASSYALRATTQRLAMLKPEDRGALLAAIKPALEPALDKFDADHPTHRESTLILAQAGDGESLGVIRSWVEGKKKAGDDHLIRAWEVLMLQSDGGTAMKLARGVIPVSAGKLGHAARGEFIARLGIRSEDDVAVLILDEYDRLEPNNKGRAIQLMTERPRWAEAYVAKVEEGKLPPTSANLNQIRRLQGYGDQAFKDRVTKIWGRIRSDRNPQRDLVVSQMRNFLARTPGDPFAGKSVFEKQCAQCHKIYGAGQEIGPELTSNGRNDYEQLLSNVFDPNLVIGENYQAVLISTKDGRTLTGLLTENSDEEVRIKIQGGTEEVFPKDQVDEIQRSTISLMPENIESLVTPQELADLFAYLALDRPPGDPQAKLLPGAPEPKRRAEGGGD